MNTIIRNLLIFIAVLLFLLALWFFRSIVVYILVAGVFSIMGRPLVDLFCRIRIKKFAFPRALGALLTLIVILGLIILFFVLFFPLVTKQLNYLSTIDSDRIVQLVDDPLRRIENLFSALDPANGEEVSLKAYLSQKVSEVLNINMVQEFLGSLFGILGNIAVAIFSICFITFFFLKDQHLFFESILMWIPDKYVDNVSRALNSIKQLVTRYFIGIIIQSTLIMALITIGMTIAGISFQQAVVMGLIIGILNVIPYVGPWLGLFIALIMGIASHMQYDFTSVVLPLVTYMIIVAGTTQVIDNIVFQPVIFSNSVKAHPLEIFIVILSAGMIAGIPGMILGIPGYTVLRVFAREFFYNFKAVQKITSSLPEEDTGGTAPIPRKRRRKKIETIE